VPRTFDLDDGSLVLIIGSGAGGGTLGNELAQKGIRTLILEAGPRIEREQHIDDERQSFAQLAWLDKWTTSGSWGVPRILQTFLRGFAKLLAERRCIGVGAHCGSKIMNFAPKMCTATSRERTF
jgi:choline dehydrogenase-like flavoprotein